MMLLKFILETALKSIVTYYVTKLWKKLVRGIKRIMGKKSTT